MAEEVSERVGLSLMGTTSVLTVGGIIAEKIYLGKVKILEREFDATIICREILDNYKVCLDGLKRIVSLHE